MDFPRAVKDHDKMIENLATICKDVHISATEQGEKF